MLTNERRPTFSEVSARHRPPRAKGGSFWLIVVLVTILCLTGVVMVLSASSIASLRQYGSPWHFFIRQLGWLAVGSLGFALALRVDHQRWRPFARPGMVVCVGLLFAVLVPVIGVRTSGAFRWLGTSSLQLQPSELAKLALVVFAADLLDRRAGAVSWRYQMMPVVGLLVLVGVLVMAQPDMGTTMVLACIAVGMLYTAGIPGRPLSGLLAGGSGAFLLLAVAAPYRWRRMTAFLNPSKDPTNTGYQATQALLALSHGHVLGDGIGSSIASYGYLPNAQTDFIFAVIGERFGFAGAALVLSLYALIIWRTLRIIVAAKNLFGALIATGVVAMLLFQVFVNVGVAVGILPVTGLTLPLMSYGGSSVLTTFLALGLLQSIHVQARVAAGMKGRVLSI